MEHISARPPVLPESLLRDTVAHRVTDRSLRRCAREIGISPNGLRDFLQGAAPRLSTRSKLERWLDRKAQDVLSLEEVTSLPTRPPSSLSGNILQRWWVGYLLLRRRTATLLRR